MNIPTNYDLQALARKILALVHWHAAIRVECQPIDRHPSWYIFYLNDVLSGALELTDEFEICVYILHPNVYKDGGLPYVEEQLDICDSLGAALHRLLVGMMDCQIDAAVDVAVTWS